jgi:hypothetical protein
LVTAARIFDVLYFRERITSPVTVSINNAVEPPVTVDFPSGTSHPELQRDLQHKTFMVNVRQTTRRTPAVNGL